MERVPIKNEPRMMEALIQEMQVQLAEGLPWLKHVFGKAERVKTDYKGRKRYAAPTVYVGGGKYERIVPDAPQWGNYSFFYLGEPQELSEQRRVMPYFEMSGEVNLIVWGDTRDIEREDDRNLESIKQQVLQVLGGMRLRTGRVTWERVWEQDRGVFEDWSVNEEENQYMMWPYAAFRFRGEAVCDTGCV